MQEVPKNIYWPDLEWRFSDTPIDYEMAVAEMEARAIAIHQGKASNLIWFLEHEPLYTGGTSAKNERHLKNKAGLPVYYSGRGGQYTYHGTGQRIIYLMLDLKKWKMDVRAFVQALEQWVIKTLADFNIIGELKCGRVGVWVDLAKRNNDANNKEIDGREDKIAAIGVRLKRWVSLHGVAINLNPNLAYFDGIVPCGIENPLYGVTSLQKLGVKCDQASLDHALIENFNKIFV